MKKHRNILKYFITLVQTFILALPLTSLVFNAVFHHLGLFNLSQSVSGNQEASVTESTFINEDNNINNYALKSLYDFNYLNTGNDITTYEYTQAYHTNDLETYEDIVYGNTYILYITDDFDTSIELDIHLIDYLSFTFNTSILVNNYFNLYTDYDYGFELSPGFNYTFLNISNRSVIHTFSAEDLYVSIVFTVLNSSNLQASATELNDLISNGYLESYSFDYFNRTETTTTIVDIPSFIEATDGLTYDEIIDNNYVNTHLLLNLDIVGLFTNNLSGNIYIMLWLNYFLNYILTFMVVFLAFDVILYFIFIIRKILDRSVEYTDRKEF